MSIFTRFVLLAGLVTLLTHGVANAQQRTELGGELAASENKYRIGLACDEVSAVLRLHLRLPDDSGLLVNAVLDDSPAGRASIQRFDVIVEANGKPVASIAPSRYGREETRMRLFSTRAPVPLLA